MTSGQFVIVRHGRTAYNAQGRLQGRTDNPLDDVGQEQALRVARHLRATVDGDSLVVCSPLMRARQTAQTIANDLDLEVSLDERSMCQVTSGPNGEAIPRSPPNRGSLWFRYMSGSRPHVMT
jgi:probable phosphoglycerate mutase